MTSFTESLTVQIMADGSQFYQELDQALSRLQQLNQQVQELGRAGGNVSRLGNAFRQMLQPLSQVSSMVTRVTSQLQQLDGMAIHLDVSPALQALNRLSAAIQQVASQLRSLQGSAGGGGGGMGWGGFVGGGGGGNPTTIPFSGGGVGAGGTSVRQFHRGGLVSGPRGVDQVPALLTAGEYVVQKSAVETMGTNALEQINQGKGNRSRTMESTINQGPVYQYGEIVIHVDQPVPLGDVLRDLQFEGHRLRNRRG